MMGSQPFRTSLLPPPLPICPHIPSHLSSFMFPSRERIPRPPLLEAKCERTTAESSLAHPPQRRGMICLSFKDKTVPLAVFLFLYFFILGCAGSSLPRRLFSSCGEGGAALRGGVWASPCGGFSPCRARAAEHRLDSCGAWA